MQNTAVTEYLRDVLGLKWIPRPLPALESQEASLELTQAKSGPILCCFVSSPTPEELKLLEKMLAAIQVPKDGFQVITGQPGILVHHLSEVLSAPVVISFDPEFTSAIEALSPTLHRQLSHPRDLIHSPELKKAAWENLKEIRRHIDQRSV